MATDETLLRMVSDAAFEGERQRGSGGVVHLDRNTKTARYFLVNEIQVADLREKAEDMLSECGDRYVFVMEESDGAAHIWKIDRMQLTNAAM